jgi:hypothetical protein
VGTVKRVKGPGQQESPEGQVRRFIAQFEPRLQTRIRAARRELRRRFPTAVEQVYDNYNFLVFGFCTTERTSDCFVSLAANAKGLGLSFYWGATLADPHRLLLGSGNQNRFLRLPSLATLKRPEVVELLHAAAKQSKVPLATEGRGETLIKSISAKQRPRR